MKIKIDQTQCTECGWNGCRFANNYDSEMVSNWSQGIDWLIRDSWKPNGKYRFGSNLNHEHSQLSHSQSIKIKPIAIWPKYRLATVISSQSTKINPTFMIELRPRHETKQNMVSSHRIKMGKKKLENLILLG